MGNKLSCSKSKTQDPDFTPYIKTDKRNGPVAPDLLPLEAAEFSRKRRSSQRSSNPNSPYRENNNVKNGEVFTFEAAFRMSQLGSNKGSVEVSPTQAVKESSQQPVKNNSDNCYVNLKPFVFPLPPIPNSTSTESISNRSNEPAPIPCEEVTPPSKRKTIPDLPLDVDVQASPKLPPRPAKSLKLSQSSCEPNKSASPLGDTSSPHKSVNFGSDKIDMETSIDSKLSPESAVKKRPKKPPRNYSYKASTLPKRISHTTEEVMELWDEVRKALSLEKLKEPLHISEEDDEEEVDEIYQNLYAARMRSWQIMCLAQDVIVEQLKPDRIWQMFLESNLMTHTDYDALSIKYCSQPESSQLIIDRILEHGDGWFDRFREELRNHEDQQQISNLLEALNDVFIIGAKANKWVFSLTTKHCSVIQSRPRSISDQPDLIGDTDKSKQPVVTLEMFDENFGNSSCGPLAEVLAKYDVITQLNLGKNKITSRGVTKLSSALRSNTSLVKLNLRLNPLDNAGAQILCEALVENKSLEELILAHTQLTAGCGEAICKMLGKNSYLRNINLSNNDISDNDCALIFRGLKTNQGLTSLNLHGNQITASGLNEIESSLWSNQTLQYLDLGNNSIGNTGVKILCDALLNTKFLSELRLEDCGITKEGCTHLARCLEESSALTVLYLSNNSIGDEGCSVIAKSVTFNTTLVTLYVNMCQITGSGLLLLLNSLCHGNTTLRTLSACFNKLTEFGENRPHLDARDEISRMIKNAEDIYPVRRIFTWGSNLD